LLVGVVSEGGSADGGRDVKMVNVKCSTVDFD
jgi:hypothetical protein